MTLYHVIQNAMVGAMLVASGGYLAMRLAPGMVARLRRNFAFWLMRPGHPRFLHHQARWLMPRNQTGTGCSACSQCGGCSLADPACHSIQRH
jgi:hypothetical protein